jgi:hypothetical protein
MIGPMRTAVGLLVTGLWAVVGACGGNGSRAPLGPTTGGDGVVVVSAERDASKPSADDDAGPVPDAGADSEVAPPAFSCERTEGVRGTGGDDMPDVTSTTEPPDFVVTRQAIRWNADCANPIMTLELSDGSCPRGMGHQLEIALSVNDIEDGVIHSGQNDLLPETDARQITVRYSRPSRLRPRGIWGTCAGVTGTIIFFEAPELVANANLQARYQFTLPACDGSANAAMAVYGVFKLQLRYALSEVCPTRVR